MQKECVVELMTNFCCVTNLLYNDDRLKYSLTNTINVFYVFSRYLTKFIIYNKANKVKALKNHLSIFLLIYVKVLDCL